ncbi:hypothetical protein FRC02_000508 [Tulasnella sp. 418]|nr:hypothetical protein FRC02_000508 [Tulasnella sp. 418]
MPPLTKKQQAKRRYKQGGCENIDGPGVWCTCVKGKEKQVIGELYDVFESIADDLWPASSALGTREHNADERNANANTDEEQEEEDLEKQLAKELESLKKPKNKHRRFRSVYVDTKCLVYISCKPPVDPVKLCIAYLEEVETKKTARTRNALRLCPVSISCVANPEEIISNAKTLIPLSFNTEPERPYRYKIQLKIRNNSRLKSDQLIPELAKCVPQDHGHTVDLNNPELVILIEVYKAVCGMSVVPDWIRFKRYNIIEVAQSVNTADALKASET